MTFAEVTNAAEFLVRTTGAVIAKRTQLAAEGRWSDLVAVLEALVREPGQQHAAGVAIDCAHLLTTAGRG